MKKSKPNFQINTPGMQFPLEGRVIILNEELSEKDAKLISEQYPEGNYISWPAAQTADKPE